MALSLPIQQIKTDFIKALAQNNMLILSAPPGAGKSTELPLWLLTDTSPVQQKIYLLQPRRVAAKNVAQYLAQQLGEPVGQTVGYRVRGETKVSSHTKLEVITEGILTQIMLNDMALEQVAMIIFDEFHERSAQADFAFALARDIQQGLRDDLILLLMSASLDNETLCQQLPDATLLQSQGRSYPVTEHYAPYPDIKCWRQHLLTTLKQVLADSNESILVFLPGQADIQFITQQLADMIDENTLITPLYGSMPLAKQQLAIKACALNHRKIVLATNIAETSVTLDGITVVIDSGLEKLAEYSQQKGINQLNQQFISQASSIQRAGRAGRQQAGTVYRLYSKAQFERLAKQTPLAIFRTDLLPLLLQACAWGVTALNQLPLLTEPKIQDQQLAWQQLRQLELVTPEHKLTALGQHAIALKCHPRLAHMLIKAKQLAEAEQNHQITSLACYLAALLEQGSWYKSTNQSADISLLLQQLGRTPEKFLPVIKQTKQFAQTLSITLIELAKVKDDLAGVLLGFAFPERIAKARNQQGDYILAQGQGAKLNQDDALASQPYLVAAELQQRQQSIFINIAATISDLHIKQHFAYLITAQQQLNFDETNQQLTVSLSQTLGKIVFAQQPQSLKNITPETLANFWLAQITQYGLSYINWPERCQQLQARIALAKQLALTITLPDVTESELIASLASWLAPYLTDITSKKQLEQLDYYQLLSNQLDYQSLQQLNHCLPERYQAATGTSYAIDYLQQPPKLSLPMQALYGVKHTPWVGDERGKKQALLLEFLSPAKRPIQLTQNLAEFWQGSYRQVQKDMKAQYPKHVWPDDPANAIATNKTKRFQ